MVEYGWVVFMQFFVFGEYQEEVVVYGEMGDVDVEYGDEDDLQVIVEYVELLDWVVYGCNFLEVVVWVVKCSIQMMSVSLVMRKMRKIMSGDQVGCNIRLVGENQGVSRVVCSRLCVLIISVMVMSVQIVVVIGWQ